MKNCKKRFSHRALALLAVVLMLAITLVSFTSCGGSSKYNEITESEKENPKYFVSRILSSNETARVRFIAASRGHDITQEDFVDTDEVFDVNLNAAKAVLEDIIKQDNFATAEDKAIFTSYTENLSKEDVSEIAKLAKSTVALQADNGIFTYILIGIGKALGWLTRLLGDYYVIAILVFAIFVEIIMLPMSIKQQKNSIGMAKLRPKIAKIEKKYAGRYDQATVRKKQEEIMALQQQEGYSPFSGCLPLIIQLIVVGFILYPIIQNPLRYMLGTSEGFSNALLSYATAPKAVGGLGLALSNERNVIELLSLFNSENIAGIKDFALISNGDKCLEIFNSLSVPKFSMFGIELGPVPTLRPFTILIIVPILNVVAQWGTMVLTRRWNGNMAAAGAADGQTNASMKIMDYVGPLMTLFIMFQVPALIGVYWFFRSLLSILKQYILKRVMPVPKYTEEELRDMEKAEKERQKAQKAAIKEQPKYRSLHYIDEDDYEELPELKGQESGTAKKKFSSSDIPEIKD